MQQSNDTGFACMAKEFKRDSNCGKVTTVNLLIRKTATHFFSLNFELSSMLERLTERGTLTNLAYFCLIDIKKIGMF